ncbi:sulfonate transport system substrate-binding protein [Paraburkholderia tropica]|uniref:Sulfonate transport system substrate-binding protein n=2 Tax=Paraburkholderia tropica TaxID=92647 RepID=A0AAQ1GJ96_9BURK|nr:sulfonate transport system substrate-binding protein [Paraburkholderia tropica]
MNDASLTRRRLLRAAGGLLAGAAAARLLPAAQAAQAAQAAPAKLTRNTDTVRIGWGYGALPDIAKQRGVFEKTLAAKNIKVEWVGPFPNHAP